MPRSPLFFYNTLSRSKEEFTPLNQGEVGLYSCGPTVYDYAHIGNLRSYILSDILRRTLEWSGYSIRQVINITDVGHLAGDTTDTGEDKIEQAARAASKQVTEITTLYTAAFFDDLVKLNIKTTDTIFPRATAHIPEQIELIKTLETKGLVYEAADGLYFDTSLYPAYTELGRLNLSGQVAGARVEVTKGKRQPADFALWKFSPPGADRLQEWDSPWGRGWPGWHLECSAMSMKYLGKHFDLHTGGEDHIPVHHTNERAQSECATGEPFVNYWLHNAFITVDGRKMSKSLGNFYTLSDLAGQGFPALAYRYFLLGAHYRSPINFTFEALGAATKAWRKVNTEVASLPTASKTDDHFMAEFEAAIADDLNTAKGLALLHEVLHSSLDPSVKRATIQKFDEILGILDLNGKPLANTVIPETIKSLVQDREIARGRGDWAQADLLRAEIDKQGYTLKDTSAGPELTPKT
ncbi:MAG: cysteine--tRNA ligase [Candidatus Vogelbacteria bacterium RIFOXYD1_FULL_46_19]|uniref:Cysteine--tRNA ligase n=1 Tax=Candidatus Vogelbacteria bacterium RIFOXYD1_FULL_46_19 TaxID=1802439 RepID=A0A1G2QH05_9BACT|nr:MAG: cysteine--tRNA ligase [Candidatus Vogelbacteria bacterium RIFOXYD1_FULL_46_19]